MSFFCSSRPPPVRSFRTDERGASGSRRVRSGRAETFARQKPDSRRVRDVALRLHVRRQADEGSRGARHRNGEAQAVIRGGGGVAGVHVSRPMVQSDIQGMQARGGAGFCRCIVVQMTQLLRGEDSKVCGRLVVLGHRNRPALCLLCCLNTCQRLQRSGLYSRTVWSYNNADAQPLRPTAGAFALLHHRARACPFPLLSNVTASVSRTYKAADSLSRTAHLITAAVRAFVRASFYTFILLA